MAHFERDFRKLCRQIDSLSAGQARASRDNIFNRSIGTQSSTNSSDREDARHQSFFIEISPKDGPYANASYVFRIESSPDNEYPDYQPIVSCITPIYHPNIDTTYKNDYNNVCVSTLNDWDGGPNSTFEDLVQGLMFLFYSPNLDDPLTSNVPTEMEEFLNNVRMSIEGGEIPDFEQTNFDVNYGYKKYLLDKTKKSQDDDNESVDDHLVELLTREPDYKKIFNSDTLEYLMSASNSSSNHTSRHLKESGTLS